MPPLVQGSAPAHAVAPSRCTKIFFDGGCRPNPGRIETAVVIAGRATIDRNLGDGTSADAEWLALIAALAAARSLGRPNYVLMGDALAIIRQANGVARCPSACKPHLETFRLMTSSAGLPHIRYVKRAQNLAGIALAALHAR